MNTLIQYIKHILTNTDNTTYSMRKLVGISSAVALQYNFIHLSSIDYQGFGIATASLMAAIAAKAYVEKQ